MVELRPDPLLQALRAGLREHLAEATTLAAGSRPGSWPNPGEAAVAATRAALARLDAQGLDAPVAAGGMGLGLAASATVAEELGRSALPEGYLAVAFAVDVATAAGAPGERVERLLAGDAQISLAGFGDERPPIRATEPVPGRLVLTGHLAVDTTAGSVLAPVELAGGRIAAILLELSAADVAAVAEPTGARGLITLDGYGCDSSTVLGEWTREPFPEGSLGRARIRQAAYLLGLARGALAAGVRYAAERRQFGQALREFQSVAFRLATSHMHVEALRLAVARASWLADSGLPYGRQSAEVLAQASETAVDTVRMTMQVCGVRAMTSEARVHRHYLRVRREARRLATPGSLWRELGRDRLREQLTRG